MPRTSAKCRSPALLVTGNRRQGRYLVEVRSHPVWLSASLFTTLCELIVARVTTRTGLVSVSPTTIWRLRQPIDEAVGREGVGDALIQTGAGSEYRLAIAVRDIVLDPSFAELPASGLLSESELTSIVRSCRRL